MKICINITLTEEAKTEIREELLGSTSAEAIAEMKAAIHETFSEEFEDHAATLTVDIEAPELETITTRDGLLFIDGRELELPEADQVAQRHGYLYAERMVRALEKEGK